MEVVLTRKTVVYLATDPNASKTSVPHFTLVLLSVPDSVKIYQFSVGYVGWSKISLLKNGSYFEFVLCFVDFSRIGRHPAIYPR